MPIQIDFGGFNVSPLRVAIRVDSPPPLLTIRWGDGDSVHRLPADPSFSAVHTYGADGTYRVVVRDPAVGDTARMFFTLQTTDTLGLRRDGHASRDLMLGGAGGDVLFGRAGDDWLAGGPGADRLRGGRGDDWLDGGYGSSLDPDVGADSCFGGAGRDVLFDSPGNDTLRPGAGADQVLLYTGGGLDTVRLGRDGAADLVDLDPSGARGLDRVSGFEHAIDRLRINLWGATSTPDFISGHRPEPADADPALLYDTDNGRLSFDADGTGSGDAVGVAQLVGAPTLTAGDLIIV